MNYLLIPRYGINGAAMATAISIFLFNFIRLVLVQIKMKMHPFSLKTLYTVLLLFTMYLCLYYFLPNSSYHFLDIIWKSLLILIIFLPSIFYLNLSEDINQFIIELREIF